MNTFQITLFNGQKISDVSVNRCRDSFRAKCLDLPVAPDPSTEYIRKHRTAHYQRLHGDPRNPETRTLTPAPGGLAPPRKGLSPLPSAEGARRRVAPESATAEGRSGCARKRASSLGLNVLDHLKTLGD